MIRSATIATVCVLLSGASAPLTAQEVPDAVSPDKTVDLLADPEGSDFTVHLNKDSSLTMERDEIWFLDDEGVLQVSGKGMGYIRTNRAYRDYHLVLEYRWGERTHSRRADRARDCGLLMHSYGPDGAYGGTWISCIEANIIEGGTGDVLVLGAKGEDGSIAPTRVTAEVELDRDGEPVWTPGAEKQTYPKEGKTMARINWKDRDPDWADERGYRGEKDIENPVGEWNRLEVICEGSSIRIILNGETVNEVTDCHPSQGYIGLQSELAECEIRRFELHPLGKFDQAWNPETGSSDMGYSITGESILPRKLPLSPEESAALWEVDGDYEIQLVAAEPLTRDPVDVVWDEKGRMFVAEMGDYPLPAGDGPFLSRIRLLTDTDGDGVMDEAVTWADDLDHVQGLLPMNGGLLATTRTAILFLEDTTGDDVADVRQPLFHSNEPRHNQLQVSSPRYGLDNHVYLNNGLDGKEIYPHDQPDEKLEFTKLNLRYDPRTGELKPSTGAGQYGGTLDDFGRHFFTTNRNPAIFAVMPLEAVKRYPLAGIAVGHEDIEPSAAPVRPIALSHTTSAAHAGTYTAACGIAAYRGSLMPGMKGDLFVCDPTGQLVARSRVLPNGASFTAERVGEEQEFLASADEWARPVQVRNGPDGALYVCDMYRRFIDHARFFPEDFAASHYMRAGLDQGRIWRIVPKGKPAKKVEALPESPEKLASLLTHSNGWHRTTAQQLLVERQDRSVVPALEKMLDDPPSPEAEVHALWTLEGLDSLKPEHVLAALGSNEGGVVENALFAALELPEPKRPTEEIADLVDHDSPRVRFLLFSLFPDIEFAPEKLAALVSKTPEDTWIRKAIMSSAGEQSTEILLALLADSDFPGKADPAVWGDVLGDFARLTAAQSDLKQLSRVLATLEGEPDWWHFALVAGLSEGLRQGELKHKSLAALVAASPDELGEGTARLQSILDSASQVALDRDQPNAARLAALPLVGQRPLEEKFEIVEQLIELREDPEIQAAACQLLARDNREQVAEFFFERWNTLPPTPLREALALITANPKSGLALMKRMKAGEISPSIMPTITRWSYGRSSNEEIKSLAVELFGQTDSDRSAVIDTYRKALGEHEGNPEKGELVFQKAACMTCHQVGEVGTDVGPSLHDVKNKPKEALLTDILDPNRAVEERWVAVTVETSDGRTLGGLVYGDDAAAITLRLPGGHTETIPRSEVKSVTSSGISLMPVGLEAAITEEEMVDLLAFLKKR
ncbi:MAG: PVC-type heme-binding CxxCH protein [Verrucomicrobiales bacterium]